MLRRVFSWIWPIEVVRTQGHFGELAVRWEDGKLVLNSANGNQSFGSLHRVWQRTLKQVLQPNALPRSVLLLGYGGGSVPRILQEEWGSTAAITAIELDLRMIELARAHFGLDQYCDLNVILGDATIRIHALRERFDLVLVDLFDDLDLARGVDSSAFMHGLRERCDEHGVVCFNTVAFDQESEERCQAVHDHAQRVFHEVNELKLEGMNRMFILR